MKIITKAVFVLTLAVAGVVSGVFAPGAQTASAHEGGTSVEVAQEAENGATASTYEYVAQAGDSYSLMARKAVQTYGAKHEVNLSLAQIIYAETMLTHEAGSPHLEVGQNVSVNEDTVKQWVESAQQLSAEAQAAWDYYAQFANFDTGSVGEPQS